MKSRVLSWMSLRSSVILFPKCTTEQGTSLAVNTTLYLLYSQELLHAVIKLPTVNTQMGCIASAGKRQEGGGEYNCLGLLDPNITTNWHQLHTDIAYNYTSLFPLYCHCVCLRGAREHIKHFVFLLVVL